MNKITEHFDKIAKDYDYYKFKNWYYYESLKKLYQSLIPPEKNLLDIGCGTGDILVSLKPRHGLGIDISQEMIKIAKSKHKEKKNIEFWTGKIEDFSQSLLSQNFDYIFMADVVEHLEDVSSAVESINQISKSNTQFIISMVNPLWEPILILLEKLKLKMPEGPHRQTSIKELELILLKNSFKAIEKNYRLILPVFLPFFSNFINKFFYRIPFLRNLGLVFFIKCSKII